MNTKYNILNTNPAYQQAGYTTRLARLAYFDVFKKKRASATSKSTAGFTVIELLIVIAIVAIIAVFASGSLSRYREEQTLRTESLAIVSILGEAKSKTLGSFDSSVYGIHLETDSVTVFKGATYSFGGADNQVHNLPSNLEIGNISIGGGSDIVFSRLSGNTINTGTFRVIRSADNANFRTISVTASGQISLN